MPDENRSAAGPSYLDFELEIGLGSGRDYPATVVRSPAGEARETFHFPFGELELENRLQALQIALLSSGSRRRRVLSPEQQAVQEFGQELFDALIAGEVRSRYDVSRREAVRQGKGLRLKLRIQPPELAALPWEFLYDARQAEYVCLSRHTPIVRYLELPRPVQPMTVALPLRILGMIASPSDLIPLDVARERGRMEEAVKDLRTRGLVDLTWLEGQSWHDLQRAMRRGPWHVFHFVGHGGFDLNADEGFIALADEGGRTHRLNATQLGRLLADHASLRLVFLNSCEGARGGERDIFSSTAATLVRRGIPAVLAMQYGVTDGAAIEFGHAFYEALADGLPVDAAVAEARKAMGLVVADTVEWGAPVLYMRSRHGDLFDIQGRELAVGPEQEPGIGRVRAWLRRLPPLAWAGLLVLLSVVGAVALWQSAGGPSDSEPTATLPVTAQWTETPTFTPSTTPTLRPTPLSCPPYPGVSAPFEDAWGAVPGMGCPASDEITGLVAAEGFEGGEMWWFSQSYRELWGVDSSDKDPFLVLYDDDDTWELLRHSRWKGPDEFTCVPPPGDPSHPDCPPTPKRGFGKVWCEEPELQDRLGQVLECEVSHKDASMQQFQRGFMVRLGNREIYVFHYDGPDRGGYEIR